MGARKTKEGDTPRAQPLCSRAQILPTVFVNPVPFTYTHRTLGAQYTGRKFMLYASHTGTAMLVVV